MITLRINGEMRTVDASSDTPLLWALRDVLGFTGTKFGCGMALCGACTVHIDGQPTRSCVLPIGCDRRSQHHDDRSDRRNACGAQDPASLARSRSRAVRLLPVRADHVGGGASRDHAASDRRANRRRDVRQHLPLRDVCAHPRGHQARGQNPRENA